LTSTGGLRPLSFDLLIFENRARGAEYRANRQIRDTAERSRSARAAKPRRLSTSLATGPRG